ncbi:MAG: hypothetical protein ABL888_23030, partial [Pirellulaceae bacterium]
LLAVLQHQLPFYRDDFYLMTGFEYEPLQTMLERRMKAENLDVESRDQLLAVYSGLSRRSEDLEMVKKLVGQMLVHDWLARNKHLGATYRDVSRTLSWLQEKDGKGSLHRSILDNIPLPQPGAEFEPSPPGLLGLEATPTEPAFPDTKNPTPATPAENSSR